MTYIYKAIDSNIKTVKGEIEAQSISDAVIKLKQLNITPVGIKEKTISTRRFRPKANHLANFTREISVMISSGIPIATSINILINSKGTDKRLVPIYSGLYKQLKKGVPLSEAMKMQENAFPEMMINMFLSGEMTGDIANVADRLSKYYDSEYKMKSKIDSVTLYPKILALLSIGLVCFLFIFVLPILIKLVMFQTMEFPLITRIMMWISGFLVARWDITIAIVIISTLFVNYIKSFKNVRLYIDKSLLNAPKIGILFRKIYTARFSMTLSYMYSSGIQLVNAVAIASRATNNIFIQEKLAETARKLRHGAMLSTAIEESGIFSDRLTASIIIGEETGKLDDVLASTAQAFEYEADVSINKIISLIEPTLIVVMASVIGTVVLSVLLPLFKMYSSLGNIV